MSLAEGTPLDFKRKEIKHQERSADKSRILNTDLVIWSLKQGDSSAQLKSAVLNLQISSVSLKNASQHRIVDEIGVDDLDLVAHKAVKEADCLDVNLVQAVVEESNVDKASGGV